MSTLMIITGAGASYDVADAHRIYVEDIFHPPLTKDLFRSGSSQHTTQYVIDCLEKNPIAAQVGLDWREGKQPLEKYLLDLRNSSSIMLKKRYWTVPIYLHELFLRISTGYIRSSLPGNPSNYQSLITAIAKNGKYAQVIWINLNYDLLADFAIKASTNSVFKTFDDYMNLETEDKIRIKYTKPHGSVDWFRHNKNSAPWSEIKQGRVPDSFEGNLSTEIFTEHLAHKNGFNDKETKRYPAILAPMGKYEYVYKQHIEAISSVIKSLQTISLLCIGFSALDVDILELLRINVKTISKLQIVNGNFKAGKNAYLSLIEYCKVNKVVKQGTKDAVFDGGFTTFIQSGIDQWLSL
ncbi:MAG: hypothetical protein ABH952_12680 [Candidatus Omnitrophota bacterium]